MMKNKRIRAGPSKVCTVTVDSAKMTFEMAAQIFFGAIVIMFITTSAHVGKPFDFPTRSPLPRLTL